MKLYEDAILVLVFTMGALVGSLRGCNATAPLCDDETIRAVYADSSRLEAKASQSPVADPEEIGEVNPEDAVVSCPPSASVTCGAGYYACCWVTTDGCPRARCQTVGSGDGYCIAGGVGATSCTVTRQEQEADGESQ